MHGALAPQLVQFAARPAHGLFGFFEFPGELVAPARVALHFRFHLVDLRADRLQIGLGLGRIRVIGRRCGGCQAQRQDEQRAHGPSEQGPAEPAEEIVMGIF